MLESCCSSIVVVLSLYKRVCACAKLDFWGLQVMAGVINIPHNNSPLFWKIRRDTTISYIYTYVKQNIEHCTMMYFQSRVSSLCSPRPHYRRRPRYPMRKSPTAAAGSLSFTYTTTPGRSWASYTRGASTPANPRPPIVTWWGIKTSILWNKTWCDFLTLAFPFCYLIFCLTVLLSFMYYLDRGFSVYKTGRTN